VQLAGVKVRLPAHGVDAAGAHAHRPVGHSRVQPQSEARLAKWPEEYWPSAEAPPDEKGVEGGAWLRLRKICDQWRNSSATVKPICSPASRGRRTDHFARGAAGCRSQRLSSWTTGHAAQEHRNLRRRGGHLSPRFFAPVLFASASFAPAFRFPLGGNSERQSVSK